MHLLYLKLIHDLADAFATGSNNTSMNSAVQGDVFRDHLLQLIHNSLNGITCCYGFMFIPSNGDLILRKGSKFNMNLQYFHKVATETIFCADTEHYFDGCNPSYLALIILLGKLDINIMLGADVRYDGTLTANDFRVVFGVHSHS